jgi:hypothetical protein
MFRPLRGLLGTETFSHPNVYFNIMLELCLTASSVGIPQEAKIKKKSIVVFCFFFTGVRNLVSIINGLI